MEPPYIPCLLRTLRRRWGLTQKDLAHLLGLKSGSHVGRLENLTRSSTFSAIFALEIVFGTEPRELFPKLHAEAEEAVMQRASALYERLEGLTDAQSLTKLELLKAMISRATGANSKEA